MTISRLSFVGTKVSTLQWYQMILMHKLKICLSEVCLGGYWPLPSQSTNNEGRYLQFCAENSLFQSSMNFRHSSLPTATSCPTSTSRENCSNIPLAWICSKPMVLPGYVHDFNAVLTADQWPSMQISNQVRCGASVWSGCSYRFRANYQTSQEFRRTTMYMNSVSK